jgi:hypothetical protein
MVLNHIGQRKKSYKTKYKNNKSAFLYLLLPLLADRVPTVPSTRAATTPDRRISTQTPGRENHRKDIFST